MDSIDLEPGPRLHARLGAEGYDVHVVFERPAEFDVARVGGPEPVAAAIVIGGDGTLRAVAHRLFLDRDEGGGRVTPQLTRFNAWVRDEARRNGDLVLDYAAALADPEGYLPDALSADGLHPNDQGKRRMADAIRRTVVEGFVHAPAAQGSGAGPTGDAPR